MAARIDWRGPGHRGPGDCIADHVEKLVAERGPLGALDYLDEARQVAATLSWEAHQRGHYATAAGLDAAGARLWAQVLHLTARY